MNEAHWMEFGRHDKDALISARQSTLDSTSLELCFYFDFISEWQHWQQ